MRNNRTTLVKKLEIVDEAERSGNVSATARSYGVQPSQIRRWRKNYQIIKEFAEKSPKRVTIHPGRKLDNPNLENMVFDWIMEQRKAELAVSTGDVIDKAVSIDPEFMEGDEKKRIYWVYRFMLRKHLAVRTRTHVSQDTAAAMLPVKQDYCRRIMMSYRQRINNPKLLMTMDETAVYLNC